MSILLMTMIMNANYWLTVVQFTSFLLWLKPEELLVLELELR